MSEEFPQGTPLDGEYNDKVRRAFELPESERFPRSLDLYLVEQLDFLFFPLCQKLAERIKSKSPEEIKQLRDTVKRAPVELPHLRLENATQFYRHEYRAALLFVDTYNPAFSKEGQVESIQRVGKSSEVQSEKLNDKIRASGATDEDRALSEELRNKAIAAEMCEEKFDDLAIMLKPVLDAYPDKIDEIKDQIRAKTFASGLHDDFPLSGATDTIIALNPARAIVRFNHQFLGNLYQIPQWFRDLSIARDLLTATIILTAEAQQLTDDARERVEKGPEFLSRETARGTDSLEDMMLMTLSEGIVSIMQAVNMGAGQVNAEYKTDNERALVQKVIEDKVSLQAARYLPSGYLGPTSVNGMYIQGFLVSMNNFWHINPEYIKIGKEIKKANREGRGHRFDMSGYELYMKNFMRGPSLSILSGSVCPVSRGHSDSESGIELLNEAFKYVFDSLE